MHEHDHYASGEVLQCSAQRHTDTETRRREQRDERRGIEAQQLNDNQQQNGIGRTFDQAAQERAQRLVHLPAVERRVHQVHQPVDDPPPGGIDREGHGDLQRYPDHLSRKVTQESLGVERSEPFDDLFPLRLLHAVEGRISVSASRKNPSISKFYRLSYKSTIYIRKNH